MDELLCRTAVFVSKCLTSDNSWLTLLRVTVFMALNKTHLLAVMRCVVV